MQEALSAFITVSEVMRLCSCSKTTGYKIIRQLNSELKEKGKLTMQGKISRKYFMEKIS